MLNTFVGRSSALEKWFSYSLSIILVHVSISQNKICNTQSTTIAHGVHVLHNISQHLTNKKIYRL
jgi:hypothetical protein